MFIRIDRLASSNLHAEGYYGTVDGERKAYIYIGPKFGTVSKRAVNEAIKECRQKGDAQWLLILGFSFESGIQELTKNLGLFTVSIVRMHDDLMQEGLLKKDKKTVLYHSRLSSALNLKLINPRKVITEAEAAFQRKQAPLAAVEGFIRQILGWREYVRGIYWHLMPSYIDLNALEATAPLPPFYWTGQTDMDCLKEVIGQTLELGYAHHIQRLMVTGLFALLLGVNPQAVHSWYLAVYVDAVEWVELPNTLGMSQFGDGGIMASKPYVATGRYIERMSNYCSGCRYDSAQRLGPRACPFTTLYWDFLLRHEDLLGKNQRMAMQLKNLARLSEPERKAIRIQAETVKGQCGKVSPSLI